ncbi:MAG: hemerythrin domain-containing protein [Rhodoferax sp.]|nr:hemerythrin domain-containing protein [Rhodoferax sp.]
MASLNLHASPSAGFEAPMDMLVACHERVQRSLDLLGRLQRHLETTGCDDSASSAAHDVLRYFDLAAPLHHQDEELHVFPVLLAGSDTALRALARELIEDHRQMEMAWVTARVVLVAIEQDATGALQLSAAQTAALSDFADLYALHIEREEGLAYPAAVGQLSVADLQRMSLDMMARRGLAS